jgi:choice-of-anchor A domain-containing protein
MVVKPVRILAAALAAAALTATPALAAESAADFQLYSLGDLTLQGNNVSHRIAAGGNATFYSTSIGGAATGLPASLVVGGDLNYYWGGAIDGGAVVAGASNAPAYLPVTAGAALPIDFAAEAVRLKDLSTSLAGQAANGAAELKGSGLFLTGLDAGLNVFEISGGMLSQATWISADIASGSQVLINVTGDVASLGGGLNFYSAPDILWNFAQATSITAGGVSLGGSILAPNAAFQGNSGTIAGDLIVGSFNGAMSFGNDGYAGGLLDPRPFVDAPPSLAGLGAAVPEPAVWSLMILGFGAVGAALRRRRREGLAAPMG